MQDSRTLIIVALAAVVAVLGYLYWDSQRSTVDIRVPGVSIQSK